MSAPPDFDRLYAVDRDPWRVGTSPYEQRKLDVVLACLGRQRYQTAWDPACGTGHLAVRLTERAARVLASDSSDEAVEIAAATVGACPRVHVFPHRLPARPPVDLAPGPDLVVLSEFLYYLDDADRAGTLRTIDTLAAPDAEVLAVHWRHVPADAWLGGAGAQAEIVSRLTGLGWSHRVHHAEDDFLLDTLTRRCAP